MLSSQTSDWYNYDCMVHLFMSVYDVKLSFESGVSVGLNAIEVLSLFFLFNTERQNLTELLKFFISVFEVSL